MTGDGGWASAPVREQPQPSQQSRGVFGALLTSRFQVVLILLAL